MKFVANQKLFVLSTVVLSLMSALYADIEGRQIQLHSRLPMVSAHRGASKLAPENTLSAFSKAIEAGANFIEIDVRTTSDGGQVIMHDSSLKRTTGLDKRVGDVTLDAIKQLSAGGLADRSEKVPTLENVCELVEAVNKNHSTTVKLYVDCKVIRAGDVVRILTRHHLLDSAVFYGNIKTLMEIKGLYDRARTMPSYPGSSNMAMVVDKLKPYAFDVPFEELNAETIQACHNIGIKVFSDLLGQDDSHESYRKAIQLGVDLIQTDDVPAVIQTFKEFE